MTSIPSLRHAVLRYLRSHDLRAITPGAALFDMDGTLYDSMPHHADAWYRMMTENGIPCSRDEFFGYEGRTGAATINILFERTFGHSASPEECAALYKIKTEYFKAMPDVSVMPGAQSAVRQCMARGLSTILVTGSGQGSLLGRLDTDFPGAFPADRRVTSHNVTHGKPHPEPYLRGIEFARVTHDRAIAFENAPLGVKSAADAGLFTIAVCTGPIPPAQMAEAGASVIFDSMPRCAAMRPVLFHAMQTVTNPFA